MTPAFAKSDSSVFDTYKKYASEPTSEEAWQKVTEALSDKSYTVQKGDTLWEISKVLFADPYFWPKIWALNKDIIFNPHSISPGDVLIFDLGTIERPPSVTIIREGKAVESTGETPLAEESEGNPASDKTSIEAYKSQVVNEDGSLLDEEGFVSPIKQFMKKSFPKAKTVQLPPANTLPELPPATRRRNPIRLPDSLPVWIGRPDLQRLIKIEITSPERSIPNITQQLKCWVDSEGLKSIGTISEVEGNMHAAHEGQYLFVKSDSLNIGGIYSVVKTMESQAERGINIYEKEGDIQIIEKSSSEEPVYRAQVLSAFSPILKGSQIVSFVASDFIVNQQEPLSQVRAKVASGFCHEGRRIFGDGEILFLKALNSTFRVGQHLPIYRNEQIRNPESKVNQSPRLIGSVQVLRVSGEWATATVVSAIEEIWTGDGTSPVMTRQ
jgi:hypothetical protein